MALFDSIIGSSIEKFGLSKESAGGLLAALVGLMADPKNGGFGGFLDKFRNAGLSSAVDSWITTGDNGPLSDTQVESALGAEAIGNFADQAGVDLRGLARLPSGPRQLPADHADELATAARPGVDANR